MATVKTAVSIQQSLYDQIESLAHELNVPRSRVVVLAIEDFIRRRRDMQLLEQINAAYDDLPDDAERIVQSGMRRRHRKIAEAG